MTTPASIGSDTFSVHRRELLEVFANAAIDRDAERISELWSSHYSKLIGARGIFCVDHPQYKKPDLPDNRTFGDRAFIRGWMASKRLLLIQCQDGGRPAEYGGHIFCDSNFVSYCEAFQAGRSLDAVKSAFCEAVEYLLPMANATNAYPYMMENAENPHRHIVHSSLEAFASFKCTSPEFFAKNKRFDSSGNKRSPAAIADACLDFMENPGFKALYGQMKTYFLAARVVLLKATLLTFEEPATSVEDRFHSLLKFLHEEVGRFAQFEIYVAHRFFVLSAAELFFSPVNPRASNLDSKLRSMAWDLAHWRGLFDHLLIFSAPSDKAAFPIPHFLTFDRRFVQLTEAFQLNGLIYAPGSCRCELIYQESILLPVSDLMKGKCHEFYTADAMRDRQGRALEGEAQREHLTGIETRLVADLNEVMQRRSTP